MEEFSITTHITTKEYAKIMFFGLYQKPAYILATLLGFFLTATVILHYLHLSEWYTEPPIFETACGVFLLLSPALIVWISVRQFKSNPSFQHDILYTFGDHGISIQGLTFQGEYLWAHIIKQKELGKFIILYHSKKSGNFIDKTALTAEQLDFIKSKVREK